MPNLRGSELLIIVLLVVLLFGAKRMPDAARSLGRSLRIFKTETKGLIDEEKAVDAQPSAVPSNAVPPAIVQPTPVQPVTVQPAAQPTQPPTGA